MGKQFTFNTTSAEQGNVYLRSTALPHYRQSAADEDQFHSFHVTPRVLLRGAKHRSLAVIMFENSDNHKVQPTSKFSKSVTKGKDICYQPVFHIFEFYSAF